MPFSWVYYDMSILSIFARARQLVNLPRMAKLLVGLYRDVRVPGWLKMAGVGAAVLIISPLDIFSDIPLLGPIDDIALLFMLSQLFIGLCPSDVVAELGGNGYPVRSAPAGRAVKNVTPPTA
jgi:uncharacterized membrane protein YkvA (DUF1232 family)